MKIFARSLLLLLIVFPLLAQAATYQEGVNYKRIVPAQPTEGQGKIEVVELFWYGCPHCYRFQPYMARWLKHKPADVVYRRMPAILRPNWALLARAFYTAQALGIADRIHQPLFDAIHAEKRRMDSETDLMKFFAEQGISNDEFKKTFHSFTVEAKVNRAREMSRRYQAEATPSVVVDGKYILNPDNSNGNFNTMIKIMNYLIDKERAAGKG
ncbi:MAG: thiol:disulfide interchange protein DsbA/DsbL [Gammaproteobacteria bacterium]|jgi:thiol:disulfide interchange protein DsbA